VFAIDANTSPPGQPGRQFAPASFRSLLMARRGAQQPVLGIELVMMMMTDAKLAADVNAAKIEFKAVFEASANAN